MSKPIFTGNVTGKERLSILNTTQEEIQNELGIQ